MARILRKQSYYLTICYRDNFAIFQQCGYDCVFQDITQIIQPTISVPWTNIEILAQDFVYESWWAVVRMANQCENMNP